MSTNTERLDPRTLRTREALRSALVKLIPQKGYKNISIKDITDQALLNRSTFYLHYQNKDDLLIKGFDEVWDQLTSTNPLPVQQDGELLLDPTKLAVLAVFKHLDEFALFYKAMLGKKGAPLFKERLLDHVFRSAKACLNTLPGETSKEGIPQDLGLTIIASAYVGAIEWWLKNDRAYTPEEMAEFVLKAYRKNPSEAIGLKIFVADVPND